MPLGGKEASWSILFSLRCAPPPSSCCFLCYAAGGNTFAEEESQVMSMAKRNQCMELTSPSIHSIRGGKTCAPAFSLWWMRSIGRSPASELKARKGVCGSCGLMLANLIFPSFPDVPICFDFEVEQKAQKHRLN